MKSYLLRTGFKLFSYLPLIFSHTIARVGAFFIVKSKTHLYQKVHCNIKACFKDLCEQEQEKLIHDSIISYLQTFLELPAIWLKPQEKVLSYINHVEGFDQVKTALKQEKGLIILTPHMGCWEILPHFLSSHLNLTCLFKPLKQPTINQLIYASRKKSGVQLAPISASGLKSLYKALEDKNSIGLLPDHDPGEKGSLFVPFFGIQTRTMTFAHRIAIHSGAPTFWAYAIRMADGNGYQLYFKPASEAFFQQDPRLALTAMNQDIQSIVEHAPAQYEWGAKRFRARPDNEPPFYPQRRKS